MSDLLPRQEFQPSCPSGGSFYACDSGTNFVGCCNAQACPNGCSDGNLKPASFDPAFYGRFQDQQCPTGSRWYTCAAADPPFMGCCKTDPCTRGCPTGDLTAAFLSSNPRVAADFLPPNAASSPASTPSPSRVPPFTGSDTTTSGDPAGSSSTPTPETSHRTSAGVIAGATVGGAVSLILFIAVMVFCLRRRASRSKKQVNTGEAPGWNTGMQATIPDMQKQNSTDSPNACFSASSYSTPAPQYSACGAESELDASPAPNAQFPSELQAPDAPLSPQRQTAQHPYPTLGEYSDGLGIHGDTIRPPSGVH